MAIFKIKKRECFAVIPNALLQDKRLSFKAKGLLCYLLHLPQDWEVNVPHLVSVGVDGRDAIYGMLKELMEAGYVVREPVRDEKGKSQGVIYNVYDKPLTAFPEVDEALGNTQSHPLTGFPEAEGPETDRPEAASPDAGMPDAEKPEALINIKRTKQENNKETAAEKQDELKNAAAFLPVQDLTIEESLSSIQKTILHAEALRLSTTLNLPVGEVSKKLKLVMLSKTSFTEAGNDFMKKLNTIVKAFRQGKINLQFEKPVVQKSKALLGLEAEFKRLKAEILSHQAALKSPVAQDPTLKNLFEATLTDLMARQSVLERQLLQGGL